MMKTPGESLGKWRIHGAGIYANIGGILMGSMLPYIAAPWILWVTCWECLCHMCFPDVWFAVPPGAARAPVAGLGLFEKRLGWAAPASSRGARSARWGNLFFFVFLSGNFFVRFLKKVCWLWNQEMGILFYNCSIFYGYILYTHSA